MNSTTNLPLISIIIPNHNGAKYLSDCLQSLRSQTFRNSEIIVVDNASSDESLRVAQSFECSLIQNSSNLGFAGAVNRGIHRARGEWVVVLNNDTELPPDWLAECVRGIESHAEAVFFACKIMDFTDHSRLFSAGDCYLRAGIGYRRGQELADRPEFSRECRIFSASGCAALYRRDILLELGGFDERFFAYLEDVDLGLRIQAAGYCGFYLPRAKVYHVGAGTSGGEFSALAVRLRTRNSLLLLTKSVPASFLLRCLPMIAYMQFSWTARVIAHWQPGSYLRGLIEALIAVPAMVRARARMRAAWKMAKQRLWQEILDSEHQARADFSEEIKESRSIFLRWYFRVFR